MPRFIVKRAFFAALRFVGVALGLLVLVEVSYCVLGGSGRHVWEADSYSRLVPGGMADQGRLWSSVFLSSALASLAVIGFAYGAILLIGYGWGIAGARMRRIRLAHFLAFPFGLLSSIPGFWLMTMVVTFTIFHWNRPGYPDEISLAKGFDFLSIWHAMVVAFPVSCGLLAWQLRAVSKTVCEKASEPYVKSLYLRGYRSEAIFYGNIFKHSLKGLIGLFDRTLSPLLGALVTVEWAYHYRGIGTLLVESARASRYEGILLTGIGMAAITIAAAFLREIGEHYLELKSA